MNSPITLASLDAVLTAPAVRCIPTLDADIDTDELLEIAAEMDERGPMATIVGMLEALRMRHAGDETTLAILAGVQFYHLPMLADSLKG